jgi:hypothetical protein
MRGSGRQTVEREVGSREEHVLGVAGHHEQPVALRVDLVVRQQPLGRHAEHACTQRERTSVKSLRLKSCRTLGAPPKTS